MTTLDLQLAGPHIGTAAPAAGPSAPAAPGTTLQPTLDRARMMLEGAQKAMQQGDWTKFGADMQALEHQLGQSPAH
jgi:hypothetical protein